MKETEQRLLPPSLGGTVKKVLSFLGLFLVLELIARCFDPADPRILSGSAVFRTVGGLDEEEVEAVFVGDLDLFWTMRPNVSGRRWLRPLWLDTRSNSFGLRDHEFAREKGPNELRILCLGGSCTYGSGVALPEAFPQVLEERLSAADGSRAYEVINAGLPGYTVFQGYQLLRKHGFDFGPDVVIVDFGLNEVSYWSGLSDVETHREMNNDLLDAMLRLDLFRLLLKPVLGRRAPAVDERGLIDPLGTMSDRPTIRVTPEEYAQYVRKIIHDCRSREIDVVLILHPSGALRKNELIQENHRNLRAIAKDTNAPLLDLEVCLKSAPHLTLDDTHLSQDGHRMEAELLHEILLENGFVPRPETRDPGPSAPGLFDGSRGAEGSD